MAYNELLADRIRQNLNLRQTPYEEKRMMGGLCFMVDDKMCIGIVKDDLMARIDPAFYEQALDKQGARPMDFTGRPMNGYVFVDVSGTGNDRELDEWIKMCLEFNPKAKSSKKKKKA